MRCSRGIGDAYAGCGRRGGRKEGRWEKWRGSLHTWAHTRKSHHVAGRPLDARPVAAAATPGPPAPGLCRWPAPNTCPAPERAGRGESCSTGSRRLDVERWRWRWRWCRCSRGLTMGTPCRCQIPHRWSGPCEDVPKAKTVCGRPRRGGRFLVFFVFLWGYLLFILDIRLKTQ